MHTDMGYWRKQGTQNTSICSGSSGEAACRSEKDGGEGKKATDIQSSRLA